MWKRFVLFLFVPLALGSIVAAHADGEEGPTIPLAPSALTADLEPLPYSLLPDASDCQPAGTCRQPLPPAPKHGEPEDYPDGLHWGSGPASLKFSGNRVRFRLAF